MNVDLPQIDWAAFVADVRRIADELTALRVMEEQRRTQAQEAAQALEQWQDKLRALGAGQSAPMWSNWRSLFGGA